jgi:hypothetical protein
VRPFKSRFVSASPRAVICGNAAEPMVAELNSKLISRSIAGFDFAIDAILSRSSVDNEWVTLLQTQQKDRQYGSVLSW